MAKYTNDDPDIKYLDSYDQTNYNFELLKYNVDSRQEARIGVQSVSFLTNVNKLKEMFKSTASFKLGLFTLITIILVIVIAIFIIVYIILYLLPQVFNTRDFFIELQTMNQTIIYIILPIIILILIYWFFNKINQQTTETGKNIKI